MNSAPAADVSDLASTTRSDPWTRALRFVPWITALVYLCIGVRYLYRAHPSEDAFILFKYVQNFTQGYGIVYYPGGPHAEGASDFLWFLALSGLRYVGVDIALAACLLNAAGAGLASFLCCESVRRSSVRGPAALAFGILSLCLVYVNSTLAGYLGFSAMFYSAIVLALPCLLAWATRAIVWAPLLALTIGLIRPDGVALGAAFALIGFARARALGRLRRYAIVAFLAVGIGAVYYAWRLDYFRLLLPLPLYVKSRRADVTLLNVLSSAVSTPIRWISSEPGLVVIAIGIALLLVVMIARRRSPWRWVSVAFVPYLVHLVMMTYATQQQNVAGRFQSPEHLAFVFTLWWCGVNAWSWRVGEVQPLRAGLVHAVIAAACVLPMIPEVYSGFRTLRAYENARLYVDVFAPEFGKLMPEGRVIALTEAGRLSYWTKARVEDTIGLNTPLTALEPPDLRYFKEISPDVLMFHAGELRLKLALQHVSGAVIEIPSTLLAEHIPESELPIFRDGLPRYDKWAPDNVAAILMSRFLVRSPEYDVYAVRYGREFDHVFAIKRSLPERERIVRLLEDTAGGRTPYRSYAVVQHFPFARGPEE